jgi:hypothetical protein
MQKSPFKQALLVMLLVATGIALVLHFVNQRLAPSVESAPPKLSKTDFEYHFTPPSPKTPKANDEEAEQTGETPFQIPHDKAEAWLAKHRRNAVSLLAMFRALNDTNYLNEAATNFPGDPQVQLAMLSSDAFPNNRRKWLAAFKASSPDNSLANYLSAADHFKNGKPGDALQELIAAPSKRQFQNYAMENLLNGEELSSDSGLSPMLASIHAMACMSAESLPQLEDFKVVSRGIAEAIKKNPASAVELVQVGLDFSGKINSGDSGKFLINQLVGTAVEKIILSQQDQNTAYDFLQGKTPAQLAETQKPQKTESQKLMTDFAPAYMQMTQSESETANYSQRMKIYGEVAAMKWLIQQHPQVEPPQ